MKSRKKALMVLSPALVDVIYGPELLARLSERADFLSPPLSAEALNGNLALLRDVQVIFSGWGAPSLNKTFMESAPALEAFFYGAGSIRGFVSDAFWSRGIPICSAWVMNAVPVIEYTVGAILLASKRCWEAHQATRSQRRYVRPEYIPGGYETTVGVISLGEIGRGVCRHLQHFDYNVTAFDPIAPASSFKELGVKSLSLEELFRTSQIVTLHTPWLKETEGMIDAALLRSMPIGSTFINTARGAVVNEPDLIEVLTERPDIQAILDVTYPEPPPPDSPLYKLPNVFLTPHIAGSMGHECRRMGQCMAEEFERFLAGHPLRYAVTREQAARMA